MNLYTLCCHFDDILDPGHCACACVRVCEYARMYVCIFLINNFIKQHVPLQGSNITCWRFLYISVVVYYTICAINYLLVFCFSAYSSCILFPYFAAAISLPLTIINSLLSAGYNVSKFIEFTNIWNHLLCLFARSQLDRGQSPPAFLILFFRVSLCVYVCMYVRVCICVCMYVSFRNVCRQCSYVLRRCIWMHVCIYACMYACKDVGNYATLSLYVDGLDFPNAHYEKRGRYREGTLAPAIHVSLTPFPFISLRWHNIFLHFSNFGVLFADITKTPWPRVRSFVGPLLALDDPNPKKRSRRRPSAAFRTRNCHVRQVEETVE
jgi:hypothetical protein